MKSRITILACFLIIALSSVNSEAAPEFFFWSADRNYAVCKLTIPIFESRTWQIVVAPNDIESGGIMGAEFRVAGWPEGYLHTVTPNPSAQVAIGHPLQGGCNIAFPVCMSDQTVLLYTIETINIGSGVGASFSVVPHTTPSDVNVQCANVNTCDPGFPQVCAYSATAYVNQGLTRLPAHPTPSDNSTDVAVNAQLVWSLGHPGSSCIIGMPSHRVYFGTNPDPPLVGTVGNMDSTVFDPGDLLPSTTYFWRIEAMDEIYGISGPLWSFTTQSPVAVAERTWDQVKLLYR